MPEHRHIPPADTKPEDVTKWYANRALWRWTRNRKLVEGGGQFGCSQCAGRVTTNAKTRNSDTIPNEAAPYVPIDDEKQCCHGMVSVPVDLLDSYQDIPFGTPAWKRSYGRRNPSEKTISMLKDKGGLKAGWCRSFGLAAHTIGVLALAIAHNVKETIGIERTRTDKPVPPARPKNHQPTRRNISADSLTPRAPPG
ncbi:MAG: transposase [Acidimicrobiia bacterium]|nr:transposase [Acidimicrobiia bacterium]